MLVFSVYFLVALNIASYILNFKQSFVIPKEAWRESHHQLRFLLSSEWQTKIKTNSITLKK